MISQYSPYPLYATHLGHSAMPVLEAFVPGSARLLEDLLPQLIHQHALVLLPRQDVHDQVQRRLTLDKIDGTGCWVGRDNNFLFILNEAERRCVKGSVVF